MQLERDQVLAFRAARHGLARPAASIEEVARGWALQDSPPGAAALALAARIEGLEPGALERALVEERTLVALYNPRTAVAIVPAGERALYAAAHDPPDEQSLRQLVDRAIVEPGMDPSEAVERTAAAARAALDGRPLSRDELHAELRAALPPALLPWCPGCESHHVRRWLIAMAGLRGALCMAGRSGRQPAFARPDQWLAGDGGEPPDRDAAAAELVRRYLARYAPSTPAHLAQWAGVPPAQARRAWRLAGDELAEVRLAHEPGRRAFALERDLAALASPPGAVGVRLVPAGDPLLLGRDRELLVPDAGRRKQVWRAIGSPGLVLAGGRPVASWRPRKRGRALEVELEPFEPLGADAREAVEREAARLAPHRGCAEARVALAS